MTTKRLWTGFVTVIIISFAVLLYFGSEIYNQAPPVPEKIVTSSGKVLFSGQDIKDGQNVWQSLGGHEIGTVWGHGAYLAPDWSADWLHREAVFLLDKLALETENMRYNNLPDEKKAYLKVMLQKDLRKNNYDPETGILTVTDNRAEAIAANTDYYG